MDKLLSEVLDGLLEHSLNTERFESIVDHFWSRDNWIQSDQAIATYVTNVLQNIPSLPASKYGHEAQVLFESHVLYGEHGTSAAIHIQAPPEAKQSPLLADKNRAPHIHASGRISVITQGNAIFYAHRNINDFDYVIKVYVTKNDIIFCPAGVAHTFDAGATGFSLVSAMAAYYPPEKDDYAINAIELGLDLDKMSRITYAAYLSLTEIKSPEFAPGHV